MDSDPSCLVTLVFDARAREPRLHAIADFVARHHGVLVALAKPLIRRYHLVDPSFGAEDAAQDALLELCQALGDGKTYPIETEEELMKLLRHLLNHQVLDERAREDAGKRGGRVACQDGAASAVRHLGADFDTIDVHAAPPDEQLIAAEEVERRLSRLAQHDSALRAIATRKADGFNHREIAVQLGLTVSTIEHRVQAIKTILADGDSTADRKNFKKV